MPLAPRYTVRYRDGMAFVKLDSGLLDSSLWQHRDCRDVFLTALLMAVPHECVAPLPQLDVCSGLPTGWIAPAGWYGFVRAAGPAIVARAGLDRAIGMAALHTLGSPESESRTPDFDGRRLIRIEGGFVVLNWRRYRERDHTAAERSRRWRDRQRMTRDDTL